MRAVEGVLLVSGLIAAASRAAAEEEAPANPVRFAEPVRLMAGDAGLGQGRYYPSPVLHDLDGDGAPEVLIGDLRGVVTFARRGKDGLGAEQALLMRDKKPLKFHNW